MAKVLDEILEGFYAKLAASDAVGEETIEQLRALLASDKKLKAGDFVAVLEKAAEESEA